MKIHISQCSDAPKVLAALYNNAAPQGLGFLVQSSRMFNGSSSERNEITNRILLACSKLLYRLWRKVSIKGCPTYI